MSRVKIDPDLVYSTWWLITIIRRAMEKARRKEILPFGITTEQAAVSNIVKALGDRTTPAEISRAMLREPNSTASIVSTMAKNGILKTAKDTQRRNIIRVSLTEEGQQILNKINKRLPMIRIMSVLSEEELVQLRQIMQKLQVKAVKEADITFKSVFD